MKLSELIAALEILKKNSPIEDPEVYSGGEDYPGPVKNVQQVQKDNSNGYEPEGVIVINGGL